MNCLPVYLFTWYSTNCSGVNPACEVVWTTLLAKTTRASAHEFGTHNIFESSRVVVRKFYINFFQEIVVAMQKLASIGLVAEGAGAAPLIPAVDGRAGAGNIVCVVSGKNIDTEKLKTALSGNIPPP